jgi:hypothetical protein
MVVMYFYTKEYCSIPSNPLVSMEIFLQIMCIYCWELFFGADFLLLRLLLESSAEVKVCHGLQWKGYIEVRWPQRIW